MRLRIPIFSLILSLAAAGGLLARTREVPLEEIARRADSAVLAACTAARGIRAGTGGMIYTVYEFNRLETVAGAATGETFTLRVAGGTAGRYRVVLRDAPRFQPGQSYLLLLRRTVRDGSLLVAGATNGIAPVRVASETGKWEIALSRRQAAAAALKAANPGPEAAAATVAPAWRLLDEIRPLLRNAVGEVSQ